MRKAELELENLVSQRKTLDRKIRELERECRYADATDYCKWDNGGFCITVRSKRLTNQISDADRRFTRKVRILEVWDDIGKEKALKELDEIIKGLQAIYEEIQEEKA